LRFYRTFLQSASTRATISGHISRLAQVQEPGGTGGEARGGRGLEEKEVAIVDKNTNALPQNIEEFNAIAGLAFAQLYKEFPARADINRDAIAYAMGVSSDSLPSGRSFSQILVATMSWLRDEGYVIGSNHPAHGFLQKLVLSEKGFRAMNAVPPSLGEPVGSHLRNLSEQPSAAPQIAEVVGSFIGGFTKSMTGLG
jgi:hypothetical protein